MQLWHLLGKLSAIESLMGLSLRGGRLGSYHRSNGRSDHLALQRFVLQDMTIGEDVDLSHFESLRSLTIRAAGPGRRRGHGL